MRPEAEDGPRFLTCCSQVFDADGAGLEFVAYETADYRIFGENPFLSRAEMRRVMARSLTLYQSRHAGRVPRRVFVHKTTEFKPREVEGVFDTLGHVAAVDLVQIKQDAGWRGLNLEPHSDGPRRATRSSAEPCCLSGGGAALDGGQRPRGDRRRNYFKEGKGIPDPLMMVRHAGHGGWEDTAAAVLGLTKMNWNR